MKTSNVCTQTEISPDIQAMRKMLETLSDELIRLEQLFDERSSRDDLTGALRRNAFQTRADRLLNSARETDSPFAILLLDVDHFKKLNDTLGHDQGDQALRTLGKLLRSYESPEIAVCRHGGEEFALAIRGNAVAVAEEIRLRVEQLGAREKTPFFTVSIGVARQAQPGDTIEALLHSADQALYLAKSNGRNRVEAA